MPFYARDPSPSHEALFQLVDERGALDHVAIVLCAKIQHDFHDGARQGIHLPVLALAPPLRPACRRLPGRAPRARGVEPQVPILVHQELELFAPVVAGNEACPPDVRHASFLAHGNGLPVVPGACKVVDASRGAIPCLAAHGRRLDGDLRLAVLDPEVAPKLLPLLAPSQPALPMAPGVGPHHGDGLLFGRGAQGIDHLTLVVVP
mmetsp:Transcript_177435/g.431614  ORF Transcript_177435/g.431614 Transcript_177435/m.431614 type:complete len:205 (+) Transcript_177435:37-651(+)